MMSEVSDSDLNGGGGGHAHQSTLVHPEMQSQYASIQKTLEPSYEEHKTMNKDLPLLVG